MSRHRFVGDANTPRSVGFLCFEGETEAEMAGINEGYLDDFCGRWSGGDNDGINDGINDGGGYQERVAPAGGCDGLG